MYCFSDRKIIVEGIKTTKQYKMWIGGKWVDAESGKTYPVFNPAKEAEIARLPPGDKADVDKAVEAA
jgi:phenylacetaldehyde dehydrogenase